MNTTHERKDNRLAQAVRALGTEDFPEKLSALLKEYADFDNLIVIRYDGHNNPTVLFRQFKDPIVFESMDNEYVKSNYILDPFYEKHIKGVQSGIFRLFDVAPDRFRQTSYYKLYYEKTTLIDEVAIFASAGPLSSITACLGRDRSSGRKFSNAQLKELNNHAAVISALIETNWRSTHRPSGQHGSFGKPLAERLRLQLAQSRKIKLSSRQAEVALLILQGHSSGAIALILGISMHTVKVFRKQLYAKCGLSSQAELFATVLPLLSGADVS